MKEGLPKEPPINQQPNRYSHTTHSGDCSGFGVHKGILMNTNTKDNVPTFPIFWKPMGASVTSIVRTAAKREGGSNVDCSKCNSQCCRTYEVSFQEGDDRSLFVHDSKGNFVLPMDESKTCKYLGKDGCTIYEHRPKACRNYDCRGLAFLGLHRNETLSMAPEWFAMMQWDLASAIKTQEDVDVFFAIVRAKDIICNELNASGNPHHYSPLDIWGSIVSRIDKLRNKFGTSGTTVKEAKEQLLSIQAQLLAKTTEAFLQAVSDPRIMVEHLESALRKEDTDSTHWMVKSARETIALIETEQPGAQS